MQGLSNQNPSQAQNNARTSTIDVPVRILVPSESVGAIIGKGGQTIRQLTQQTRAKVDVYRGDPMAPNTALQEKVITIRGQPENCINACREILKVMKVDAESKGKPSDAPLKVLAHNDYIGRIIGKQGNIINTIKKETDTTVTVSSINDMSMNVERVITVKGELENMIRALEIIHSKVKSAFENDTKTYGAQAIMMGGIPPLPLAPPAFAMAASASAAAAAAAAFNAGGPPNSTARFAAVAAAAAAAQQQHQSSHQQQQSSQSSAQSGAVNNAGTGASGGGQSPYSNYYQPMYHSHPGMAQHQQHAAQNAGMFQMAQSSQMHAHQQQHQQHQHNDLVMNQGPEPETVYLYIPNVAVGAIIGTKGSYIKNIIKLSGASVKITPLTPEESKVAVERQVVIIGTPESQWKAQYYIYDKIRQERFASDENVKLRAELQVPSHIVGRIIGKSGKNVRELQRSTGATIKLPEDTTNATTNSQTHEQQEPGTVTEATNTGETSGASTANATTNGQKEGEEAAASNGDKTASEKSEATIATTITTTNTNTAVAKSETSKDEEGSQSLDATAATSTEQENLENQASTVTPLQGHVIVRIFGTFQASQCAQRRIQSLVSQSLRGVAGPSIMDVQNPMGAHFQHMHPSQHHNMVAQTQLMAQRSFNNMSNHHQHHQIGLMPISNHFHHRGGNGVDYQQQNGGPRMNGSTYTRHNRRLQSQQQGSKDSSFNNETSTNLAVPQSTTTPAVTDVVNGTAQSAVTTTSSHTNVSSSSNSTHDQDQSPSVSSSSTSNQTPQTPIIAASS